MRAEGPRAGVLGLGIIGSRVAACIRAAGIPLRVWNRTPRVFAELPAPSESAADVAQTCDILQVFVSDDEALNATIRAILPVLSEQHVVLSHATVAPETVRKLAVEVGATGATLLDAPFTGSRDAAAQGQLTYYVAGDKHALARAQPVLAASARAIVPLDAIGQASTVKIATNVISAAAAVSLAEALHLLRANGIDPSLLATALETNAARSGVTDLKLPCILAGDFAPRFALRHMLKDIRLARAAAGPGHHSLIDAMASLLDLACAQGLGDEDFSAVFKAG